MSFRGGGDGIASAVLRKHAGPVSEMSDMEAQSTVDVLDGQRLYVRMTSLSTTMHVYVLPRLLQIWTVLQILYNVYLLVQRTAHCISEPQI